MSNAYSSANRQHGFGLLEAIVALTLMASVGMALFTWIRQGLETAYRLRDAQADIELRKEAAAAVEHVNPATWPDGEVRIDGLRVSWRSQLLEPARPVVGFFPGGGGVTPWQVGLYRLEVTAEANGLSRLETRFQVTRVGWQRGSVEPAHSVRP